MLECVADLSKRKSFGSDSRGQLTVDGELGRYLLKHVYSPTKTDAEKFGKSKRGKYLFSLVRVRSRKAAKGGFNVRVKGMGRIKASRSRE